MPARNSGLTAQGLRAELIGAALDLLDADGPDALQTRKVAAAVGASTMAVYTHFGGMQALIAAVAEEGLQQFDRALSIPDTDDPVCDLLRNGLAYRQFAIERPHLYRLMFGSTSAHGIKAPAADVMALAVTGIDSAHPSFAHVVRAVHRCAVVGRITAISPDDDLQVLVVAAQFWTMMHGYVMLELAGFLGDDPAAFGAVLGGLGFNNLVALGDDPAAVRASQLAAIEVAVP